MECHIVILARGKIIFVLRRQNGPPIPPRIMLCIAELAMVYAFVKNSQAGTYDHEPLNVFYGSAAVAAAVPQLTSLVHRSAVAKSVAKTA
jgi:hypothetical protein